MTGLFFTAAASLGTSLSPPRLGISLLRACKMRKEWDKEERKSRPLPLLNSNSACLSPFNLHPKPQDQRLTSSCPWASLSDWLGVTSGAFFSRHDLIFSSFLVLKCNLLSSWIPSAQLMLICTNHYSLLSSPLPSPAASLPMQRSCLLISYCAGIMSTFQRGCMCMFAEG